MSNRKKAGGMGGFIQRIDKAAGVLVIGFAVVAGSVFLPWLEAEERMLVVDGIERMSMAGIDALDGVVLLGSVTVLVLLAGILRLGMKRWHWASTAAIAIAGLLAAGMSSVYIVDQFVGLTSGPLSAPAIGPGIGLYFTFLGGLLLLAAAALAANTGLEANRTTSVEGGISGPP